ncbi:hypothetical protein BS78_03G366200 [Paspalum vaginatum]|nr:hypothetical protein BS78_03G366200 [Paspalum vaginatum]
MAASRGDARIKSRSATISLPAPLPTRALPHPACAIRACTFPNPMCGCALSFPSRADLHDASGSRTHSLRRCDATARLHEPVLIRDVALPSRCFWVLELSSCATDLHLYLSLLGESFIPCHPMQPEHVLIAPFQEAAMCVLSCLPHI